MNSKVAIGHLVFKQLMTACIIVIKLLSHSPLDLKCSSSMVSNNALVYHFSLLPKSFLRIIYTGDHKCDQNVVPHYGKI